MPHKHEKYRFATLEWIPVRFTDDDLYETITATGSKFDRMEIYGNHFDNYRMMRDSTVGSTT